MCEIEADDEGEAGQIRALLEAIYRHYRYDFRDYAYPSIRRRVGNAVRAEGVTTIAELMGKLLDEPASMERFLQTVTVNVTTMFRDPDFYRAVRDRIAPRLRSLPFVRIWHAGCSTGQEVYSLAILLEEEGIYDRCLIYATDMNLHALEEARDGIVPLARLREYTSNYLAAGGTRPFSEYYTADDDYAIFRGALRRNIIFSRHDLAVDGPFHRFHVIFCRNVLIYFNEALANRIHGLLYNSLETPGHLALGVRESIRFTPHEACYEEVEGGQSLYCKVRSP
jgi:chemotaxis protein methyltransferase CheR